MDISNQEILSDIHRLTKELEAYQMIANGFRLLASIPEKAGSKSGVYRNEADHYREMESSCAQSIRILHSLKAERGL